MRYLAFVALLACSGKQTAPPPTTEPTPAPKAPANAMTCKTDADCPEALACGPCNAGEVLTSDNTHPECVVNPCGKSMRTACSNGACVVK